jgi:glycosyltransferase involved in cell wall biosynthesis
LKILMVNTLYPPTTIGGAERSVALLARALVARGDQVSVACIHDGPDIIVEDDAGVQVYRLPIRNIYWPFDKQKHSAFDRLRWHIHDRANREATRDILKLITQLKPDVLHTNNLFGFSSEIWQAARKRGVRVVHTLRDYSLLCARATLFNHGSNCDTRCMMCATLTGRKKDNSVHVDMVASNSAYVIDMHRKYHYFNGIESRVIYNILDDLTVVQGGEAMKAASPDAEVTFGLIGRVEQEKGVEIALDAFTNVQQPNWRLKVAGSGQADYVARLRAHYPDDRIEWLGFVDSDAFYDQIDVAVLASIWPEPLPRTMIECLGRGKPMLFADAGGMPEIGHYAPRAIMYPHKSVTALGEAIETVLADPLHWKTSVPCEPELLQEFSEDHVVDAYRAVYAGTVAQQG